MADTSEPSNSPQPRFEQVEQDPQQQAITMDQPNPQSEPILIEDDEENNEDQSQQQQQQQQLEDIGIVEFDPDTDEDYRRYLIDYIWRNGGRIDHLIEPLEDEDDDEDYVDDDDFDDEEDELEEDSYSEEEEDDDDDDEEEEEDMDLMVTSPRVSINSVEPVVVGEVAVMAAAVGEGGEIDGLICPICMEPWTSGGDHQVCCLSCGHLYGLSCIRRWLEHRKGSAKCPQCNKKCKPKDVRVLYASRVVVADEESKEKIKFLEAKCALLEKKNETLIKKNDDMLELIDEQSKLLSRQTERVNHLMTTQQSEINALQAAQTESARSMHRLQAEHTESERRFQQFEAQQSESLQRIHHYIAVAGIDISRLPRSPSL